MGRGPRSFLIEPREAEPWPTNHYVHSNTSIELAFLVFCEAGIEPVSLHPERVPEMARERGTKPLRKRQE